jgi:hypothetical protein
MAVALREFGISHGTDAMLLRCDDGRICQHAESIGLGQRSVTLVDGPDQLLQLTATDGDVQAQMPAIPFLALPSQLPSLLKVDRASRLFQAPAELAGLAVEQSLTVYRVPNVDLISVKVESDPPIRSVAFIAPRTMTVEQVAEIVLRDAASHVDGFHSRAAVMTCAGIATPPFWSIDMLATPELTKLSQVVSDDSRDCVLGIRSIPGEQCSSEAVVEVTHVEGPPGVGSYSYRDGVSELPSHLVAVDTAAGLMQITGQLPLRCCAGLHPLQTFARSRLTAVRLELVHSGACDASTMAAVSCNVSLGSTTVDSIVACARWQKVLLPAFELSTDPYVCVHQIVAPETDRAVLPVQQGSDDDIVCQLARRSTADFLKLHLHCHETETEHVLQALTTVTVEDVLKYCTLLDRIEDGFSNPGNQLSQTGGLELCTAGNEHEALGAAIMVLGFCSDSKVSLRVRASQACETVTPLVSKMGQ